MTTQAKLTATDLEIGWIYYRILIGNARTGKMISYGDLVALAKAQHPENEIVQRAIALSAGRRLDAVRVFTNERGYPDITSLVVNGATGEVGAAFGTDPVAQRAEVAAFDWTSVDEQFGDFISDRRADLPVKRKKVKLDEAKRLIWSFFKEHETSLPKSIKLDGPRLREMVMDGHSVADAFEAVAAAKVPSDGESRTEKR